LENGKEAIYLNSNNLYALGHNFVEKIDPRILKYRVAKKSYKGDMNFTHILGFKEENFAVGSLTGELRLYSKIGENAKNLLPSYLGDKIIDMD